MILVKNQSDKGPEVNLYGTPEKKEKEKYATTKTNTGECCSVSL